MRFHSLDEAAARLVEALSPVPLPAPHRVFGVGEESRPMAERVAARLASPVEVRRVELLPLPWYPRITLGALTPDNHHYADPVVAADHSLGAREVAQLCRDRLPALRGPGWRKPPSLAGATALVIARSLTTGYRALALCASLKGAGAGKVVVASPCATRDAIDRVESAAPLVVLAPSDAARFDPDSFFPPTWSRPAIPP